MLDSLTLAPETKNDRLMIDHLVKEGVHTLEGIKKAMRKAKLTDKRYMSLHLFSKCFNTNYVPFTTEDYNKLLHKRPFILKCFMFIEGKYMAKHGKKHPFFNYKFLIAILLDKYGLSVFKRYLKPIKCAKRIRQNIDRLNDLHLDFNGMLLQVPGSFQMNR